jgi:CRISPR/Cas system-associated endonuclease Cas3-HD
MKLVVNNTLKPFVNNPELYNPFLEEITERINKVHKRLEQISDVEELYRAQGEIRALRSMLVLREHVNG